MVYDSLVGDGVLAIVPASAEKINVGKRAGHHTMKQENINQVLLEKAQEGKRVVRLKGGDPFLFGRGGEELELSYGCPAHPNLSANSKNKNYFLITVKPMLS